MCMYLDVTGTLGLGLGLKYDSGVKIFNYLKTNPWLGFGRCDFNYVSVFKCRRNPMFRLGLGFWF